MATNLLQDLNDALAQFEKFLKDNTQTIKPAVSALSKVIPQVGELISKLIDLMNKLKTAVQNLNLDSLGPIPNALKTLASFTSSAQTLLTTAENLLPDQKSNIDSVLSVISVVNSLPSLGDLKQKIADLITAVIADLQALTQA